GVAEMVDAVLVPAVALPGGGHMMIEPTRALVAVDVNTGPDTSPAASLKANIAAARDLPRQLRLRGLGGQVVVDFAPMSKRDRAVLDQVLRAAFKGESAETSLAGWTPLGLFELVRKRDRLPLAEVLR
ncbi:MAG: ribonuclease G, partial [Rhodobacterales bacterium]|nr:ribonuclease G [Rhodobacterales bacterium]